MRLVELLSEQSVCLDLKARHRDEAVRELAERLVSAGVLPESQLEPLVAAVLRREALGTTAIGRGVAVPHARTKDLHGTYLVLGLSREGVQFESLDGEPVHTVFLVLGSEDAIEHYTDVLKRISALIHNDDFLRFLSLSRKPREVVELVAEMDR